MTGTILNIDTLTGTAHITVDIRYENFRRLARLLGFPGPTTAMIGEFLTTNTGSVADTDWGMTLGQDIVNISQEIIIFKSRYMILYCCVLDSTMSPPHSVCPEPDVRPPDSSCWSCWRCPHSEMFSSKRFGLAPDNFVFSPLLLWGIPHHESRETERGPSPTTTGIWSQTCFTANTTGVCMQSIIIIINQNEMRNILSSHTHTLDFKYLDIFKISIWIVLYTSPPSDRRWDRISLKVRWPVDTSSQSSEEELTACIKGRRQFWLSLIFLAFSAEF